MHRERHIVLACKRDRDITCAEVAEHLYVKRISPDTTVLPRVHELSDLQPDESPYVLRFDGKTRVSCRPAKEPTVNYRNDEPMFCLLSSS